MATYKPVGDVVCPCSIDDNNGTRLWLPCKNRGCETPWWHASCAGFQTPKQAPLKAMGDWHCPHCVSKKYDQFSHTTSVQGVDKISKKLEEVLIHYKKNETLQEDLTQQKEDMKSIKQNLQNLQDTLANKFEKLDENFTNKVNNQKNELQKSYAEALGTINSNLENNEVISTISQNLISVKKKIENHTEKNKENENEKKIKEIKMKNLCIFNLPEHDSDDAEAQSNADIIKLKKLFHGKVHIEQKHVQSKPVSRLGEYQTGGRPRPLILRLNDLDKRMEILQLRNLTIGDSENEVRVFIQPDRTKREQLKQKELREELKKRRLEANEGQEFVIRGDKIIERMPFRSSPQTVAWGN